MPYRLATAHHPVNIIPQRAELCSSIPSRAVCINVPKQYRIRYRMVIGFALANPCAHAELRSSIFPAACCASTIVHPNEVRVDDGT